MNRFTYSPVNLFYLFLSVYLIVAPVDVTFTLRLLSLLFVLFIWTFCFLGRLNFFVPRFSLTQHIEHRRIPRTYVALLIVLQFFAAIFAGEFYTGLSFSQALINFFSGVSNYNLYQDYFGHAGLGQFGYEKIPAIISIFFVKICFVFSVFSLLINNSSRFDFILLALGCLPLIIIGVFRGTTIEFFEIFVAIVSGVYIRSFIKCKGKFPVFTVLLGAIIALSVYSFQVNIRYNFDYIPSCHNEFCYNKDSLTFQVFPVLYKISSYFYFGPDYMARLLEFFVENGVGWQLIFPGGGELLNYSGKWLCHDIISCGPTWAPDFEISVYFIGLPATFLLIFFISKVQRNVEPSASSRFISFLGFYLVTLQLVAFPVGNFLFTSSANQLMLVVFVFFNLLRKISRIR